MFDKGLIVLLLLWIVDICTSLPLIPSHLHDVNSSLFWGTYRPGIYFGTKTRSSSSLNTGIMWFNANSLDSYSEGGLRHSCEQGDKLKRYGWVKHNGKNYGKQEIEDPNSNVVITTEFIKFPSGKNGGEWVAKIKGTPSAGRKEGDIISLLYYVAAEDSSTDLKLIAKSGGKKKGIEGDAYIKGKTKDLGDFIFVIQDAPITKYNEAPELKGVSSRYLPEYQKTHYIGVESKPETAWRVKDVVNGALSTFQRKARSEVNNILSQAQLSEQPEPFSREAEGLAPVLPDTLAKKNQIIVLQKVLKVPFEVDVVFISGSSHTESINTVLSEAPQLLEPSFIRASLDTAEQAFDERFENTFHLAQKGFTEKQQKFAKFAMSNLIGGIGYWHGSSKVGTKGGVTYSAPRALFSAVPSRPFFPRGFLWDEGFHQLLISKWDTDLTMEILTSWLNSMDDNGWMEREQILGEEARSKVPAQFQTQNSEYANPPTLLFSIRKLAEKVLSSKQSGQHSAGSESVLPAATHTTTQSEEFIQSERVATVEAFLKDIMDRLDLNFKWFVKTQKGETRYTFRWRGKTDDHTLTSGFDDYPRETREGDQPVNEHHLDLLCWMTSSAESLSIVAKSLALPSKLYDDYRARWIKAIDDYHWNEQSQSYADLATHVPEKHYIVHDGYISLFPLLLGLISHDSPKLNAVLEVIRDPAKLWSQFGVLSLSRKDPYFGTQENYWRGAIWINVNYLILSSLHNNYINKPGPYQEKCKDTYTKLRSNIIDNMFKNFESTGYIWEQYNPTTGAGQRSHPFTGWSALVVLIMAEDY